MHPRTTNTLPKTFDVYAFSFESAGALALDNEYSGFAVAPAHYIGFAERKHACPYPSFDNLVQKERDDIRSRLNNSINYHLYEFGKTLNEMRDFSPLVNGRSHRHSGHLNIRAA